MEMENQINSQCKQLLDRIQSSNVRSLVPKSRIKQDKDVRLQSLSLHRRKINQSMNRQFSLTGGIGKTASQQSEKFPKLKQKTIVNKENEPVCQPQFNLRKGTKSPNKIAPLRKPFASITNVNKFRLTLCKDKGQNMPNIKPASNSIEQSLQVNSFGVRYHTSNEQSYKDFSSGGSTQRFNYSTRDALSNANTVNDVFNFIKGKVNSQNEEIGQFTQIIFKLVCYFFVSFISEHGGKVQFDHVKMAEFVERQMNQSYDAFSSFKRSRKQNLTKSNLNSIQNIVNQILVEKTQFVRKNNRVSSFFKSVEHGEQSEKQDQKIESLRKFNRSMGSDQNQAKPQHHLNSIKLKIPQRSSGRRLSIALNSVQEDNQEHSQRSDSEITERQNSPPQKPNSNQVLTKMSFRAPNTRRKSCFLTGLSRFDIQAQKSSCDFVSQSQQKQKQSPIKIRSPATSNNGSRFNFQSQGQLNHVGSNAAFSNSKLQGSPSRKKVDSKQKISSKASLNLNTPYDFLKDDNLMTKRRKYLQLHQKITEMTDNINQLRKQEQYITQKIELKDSQLIGMENKLLEISKQIEIYEERTQQATQFLNGPQCPQMVQKIIKKNIELKKNLQSLINSHAWESSNLSQSSNIQHIMSTKQSSHDKLNSLSRKFRGCKNLQEIQSLVGQMRDTFLLTVEKYSQIIDEFQDKIKQAEEEKSNMLKNLEDWEMENKIKEKLLNNSFLDYYSVQRRVTTYIQKLPESLKKLQQYIYVLSQQRKLDYSVSPAPDTQLNSKSKNDLNRSGSLKKINTEANSKRILMIEKEMVGFIEKILNQNTLMALELPKQKKFAMILEKIV